LLINSTRHTPPYATSHSYIDPDEFLAKDENGQLRPISSKLDAVAAELFPHRAKINSKFNEKLVPLTKDTDGVGVGPTPKATST
jgi:hypothetical protein